MIFRNVNNNLYLEVCFYSGTKLLIAEKVPELAELVILEGGLAKLGGNVKL